MNHEDEIPLFAAQGGGYATLRNGRYVWHSEIPDYVNAQVGDPIPDEWGVVGINDAAHHDAYIDDVYDDYPDDEEDDFVSTTEVYGRAFAHFGNHELAREATEMYPGDFI